jgi:hypothetical protein
LNKSFFIADEEKSRGKLLLFPVSGPNLNGMAMSQGFWFLWQNSVQSTVSINKGLALSQGINQ